MEARLQKLKRTPAGLAAWVVLVCGGYILAFGGQFRESCPMGERLLWTVLSLVLVLIGHELLHALAAKLLAGGPVRIEAARDPMGLPALRTVFPAGMTRGRRMVVSLTPLVVLTVLPTILLICAEPVFFLFMVAMLNGAGVYYDLLDTALLLCAGRTK